MYRVRVCFELESSRTLSGLSVPVAVETAGLSGTWSLKEVAPSSAKKGQRIDLRSPPVSDEADATAIGSRACAALMAIALRHGFGVVLAERVPGLQFFEAGRRLLAGDRFDELLDDELGTTVYEDDGRVGFLGGAPPQVLVSSPAAPFLREWSAAFLECEPAKEAVATSFDLWSSSRFESSSRVRLLLLVMAVEALVTRLQRPQSEREVIDGLMKTVEGAAISVEAKSRLRGGLAGLKKESVGSSCRSFVETRLGPQASETFQECYRLRNVMAHGGRSPAARTLVSDANRLEPIVKDLLLMALAGQLAE
jgi:hypothetical protein